MNIKSKSTLEKFKKELSFKNYSERTIEAYIHYAGIFLYPGKYTSITQTAIDSYLTNIKIHSNNFKIKNQIIFFMKIIKQNQDH